MLYLDVIRNCYTEDFVQRQNEYTPQSYWAELMDEAFLFMEGILAYPVQECGESCVELSEVIRGAHVPVVLSTSKIGDVFDRMFFTRSGLVGSFVQAARLLAAEGLVLKVEDCYRTTEMQKTLGLDDRLLNKIFNMLIKEKSGAMPSVDEFMKRLSALVATTPKTGTHMSASAMDISVLRASDFVELERGGSYLELSEKTPMASPFILPQEREARDRIQRIMFEAGFIAYPYEFWHFCKGDAYGEYLGSTGVPACYGPVDIDVRTGKVTPIANPTGALIHREELLAKVVRCMEERL
jgi:zinc D-Ala-D-Ala dipeptidase